MCLKLGLSSLLTPENFRHDHVQTSSLVLAAPVRRRVRSSLIQTISSSDFVPSCHIIFHSCVAFRPFPNHGNQWLIDF